MSQFDSLFADVGLPVLMDQLGRSITYTPASGSPTSLTAIVGNEELKFEETQDGEQQRRVRDITICTDPTGPYGGVASPANLDQVTFGSVVYVVKSIQSVSSGMVRLEAVRIGSHEKSRPDYRG